MFRRLLKTLKLTSELYSHYGIFRDLFQVLGFWKVISPMLGVIVAGALAHIEQLPTALILIFATIGGCVALALGTFIVTFSRAWRMAALPIGAEGAVTLMPDSRRAESPGVSDPAARDMPVAEALIYVASAIGKGPPGAQDRRDLAARELRQAALDDDVPVWGRRMPTHFDGLAPEDRPLVRIDPAYWEDHALELLAFLEPGWSDEHTVLLRTSRGDRDQHLYRDLWTSRARVERRWPRAAEVHAST